MPVIFFFFLGMLLLLFTYAAFWAVAKIKSPFWSIQPMAQKNDYLRNLFGNNTHIQPLYCRENSFRNFYFDPKNVTTMTLSPFSYKVSKNPDMLENHLVEYLKIHKSSENRYCPTTEYLLSFFNEENYVSFFTFPGQQEVLGFVTSRAITAKMSGQDVSLFYMDFLVTHEENNTAREKQVFQALMQTHLSNQVKKEKEKARERKQKDEKVRKLGVITLIKLDKRKTDSILIPLFCHHTFTIQLFQETILPLSRRTRYFPVGVDLFPVGKGKILFQDLFGFLRGKINRFSFSLIMDEGLMEKQVEEKILFIHVLKQQKKVLAVYFLREEPWKHQVTGFGDTLRLVASFCFTSVELFDYGFHYCLRERMRYKKTYRTLMVDEMGDTLKLSGEWKWKHGKIIDEAYYCWYLHNAISPCVFQPVNCVVI